MTQLTPQHPSPPRELVSLLRAERDTLLEAWTRRVASLPAAAGASVASRGGLLLEWLAIRLEDDARADELGSDLIDHDSFSAPRVIAELALLTQTVAELLPPTSREAALGPLHRAIDSAIARSIARDADEAERLRKRLRLASDVTLAGCWELDPATGNIECDSRTRDLFGISNGQATTLDELTSLVAAEDRERVRAGIAAMLGSGQPYLDECRTLRADGGTPRWIAIAADAHQGVDEPSPRVLGIVHDVTGRRRSDEERERVLEELTRAVHISEMFVGVLSHDLRTPLSAILAGASMLGSNIDRVTAAKVAARVVSSGQRMVRMIDQLLDFTRSRLGEGIPLTREPLDVLQLAREAIEEGRADKPETAVELVVSGDLDASGDRDRLAQIFSNLLGNALQHGAPGGSIEIAVDGTDPGGVAVSITNQGPIPPSLLPVIFNPFRGTLQKRGKPSGLGLGLYVARQIALAHGGELEVACTETTTTFRLSLPRGDRSSSAEKQLILREDEMVAYGLLAGPISTTAVTAKLFGAAPLSERSPVEYAAITHHYRGLLDTALHRKAYVGQGEGLASDLRALAERLGDLGASPREVTEVHADALRSALRGVTPAKTAALLSEGRLVALELMGNLAGYYRRRSPTAGAPRDTEAKSQ